MTAGGATPNHAAVNRDVRRTERLRTWAIPAHAPRRALARLGRRAALRTAADGPRRSPSLDDLVVITGYSGAGKSTAMAVFEDAGYFCVDNLPPEMIRSLAELFLHEGSAVERAAVVSDVRGAPTSRASSAC